MIPADPLHFQPQSAQSPQVLLSSKLYRPTNGKELKTLRNVDLETPLTSPE